MVKRSAVELITTIHSAGGGAIALDRRAKLNDRLQHRSPHIRTGSISHPKV